METYRCFSCRFFSFFLYQFLSFQLLIIHLLTQTLFLIGLKLDLTLNQMDRGDKQKKRSGRSVTPWGLPVCFRAAEACGAGHGSDQPGHETGWEKPDWSLQVLRPLCLPLWQVHWTFRWQLQITMVFLSYFVCCIDIIRIYRAGMWLL